MLDFVPLMRQLKSLVSGHRLNENLLETCELRGIMPTVRTSLLSHVLAPVGSRAPYAVRLGSDLTWLGSYFL